VFTVPSCSTFEDLKAVDIIAEWVPVTAEDLCHRIEEEHKYWCERIRAVNVAQLPVRSTK
jgi:hypothetical protein